MTESIIESTDNHDIDFENPLYLVFSYADAYIMEESHESKYFIFPLTKKKNVSEIYRKLRNEIKNQIKTINGGELTKYKKDFMKITLNSNDDDLPLGKVLSFSVLGIVVKSAFQNKNKCYPQIRIHECEY